MTEATFTAFSPVRRIFDNYERLCAVFLGRAERLAYFSTVRRIIKRYAYKERKKV